jgi:Cu/Ag efflux protein CusF
MKAKLVAAALAAIATSLSTIATAAESGGGSPKEAMEHVKPYKLRGVVNSVDRNAARANITHDGLPSLKWPKMKINFKAHDAALLKDLKPGMRVDFEIEKMGEEYYITRIAPER